MGSGFRRKGFKGKDSLRENFAGVDRSGRGVQPPTGAKTITVIAG